MIERIWKNRAAMVPSFTVRLNGAFVQWSPAGCPGKLNSPRRVKIQTGCKSNSSELMKYACYVEVPAAITSLLFEYVY